MNPNRLWLLLKNKSETIVVSLLLITLTLKENINSIAIIIFFTYSLFCCYRERVDFKKGLVPYLPFIIYFIAFAISALMGSDGDNIKRYLLRFLPFLIIPTGFSIIRMKETTLKHSLSAFIIWILINAIFSHFVILKKLFDKGESLFLFFRKDYSYLTLAETVNLHPTYYSIFILGAILILMNRIFFNKKTKHVYAYIFLVCYFSFFIIHLSSRMNIAALALMLFGYILFYFKSKKKLLKGFLLIGLSAILLTAVLYNVRATRYRFQQVFGFTFSNGTRHDDGLDKIKQFKAVYDANKNFLIGNGVSRANESIYESYKKSGLSHYAERKYNAHNQYLQSFVGFGIIGVLLLLFILIFYANYFFQNRLYMPLVFVVVISFLFLTESYLERQNGIVMIISFICLNIAAHESSPRLRKPL